MKIPGITNIPPGVGNIALLVAIFAITGCARIARVEFETPQDQPTSSPTMILPPTLTPSPTPTAIPAEIKDVRPSIPQNPNPLGLMTRCGVADVFDYPLDPPDAKTVRGGRDFGVYRDRYDGYHTGEDWWYERGRSLGKPIFSIGDGRVRYVASYGWGDDLGTLVIEHILPDGRRLYSFYGHVEPDSLKLRTGQCVARGEQIGLIGDPRSSPHLHFEIRVIFADVPGPGYWSVDPARSGWLPPSQMIEFSRYSADQRVRWSRTLDSVRASPLGWLTTDLLLMQEDKDLVVIDVQTGEELLREGSENDRLAAVWEAETEIMYIGDHAGVVRAVPIEISTLLDQEEISIGDPIWQVELDSARALALIPQREGLIILEGETWHALTASGRERWTTPAGGRVESWVGIDDGVLLAIGGDEPDLWTLSNAGAQAWDRGKSGVLFNVGGRLLLYAEDALYKLELQSRGLERLLAWNHAQLEHAGALEMPLGRMLLSHKDVNDHRLMMLDPQGWVLWERSLASIAADDLEMIRCMGTAWLVVKKELPSGVEFNIYSLDEQGVLERRYQSVIRSLFAGEIQSSCVQEKELLITLGEKRQLLFEPPRSGPEAQD